MRNGSRHAVCLDDGFPCSFESRRVHYERVIAMGRDDAAGPLLHRTRRLFFQDCAIGLGTMALSTLRGTPRVRAATALSPRAANPLAPQDGHFPGRAKSVIY